LHVLTAEFALAESGTLVRISGDTIITTDLDIIFRMNGVRSPYRKSAVYKSARLDPTSDNVLSTLDEAKHSELRTKMAAGVSNPVALPSIFRNAKGSGPFALIVLRKRKHTAREEH
jgi:hypothetical protein